jgi:PAS domain S-box-containing protein
MARMFGRPAAADLVGTPLRVLLPRHDQQNDALLRAFIRSDFTLSDLETRERRRGLDARVFLNSIVGIVEHAHLVRVWGTRRDVTERRRAELIQAATYQISEAAATTDSLDQLLPQIHRIVATLIPAENVYVALLSDDGTQLVFPYHVDESDDAFTPRPLGKGLTEYVLRTRQPLLATPAEWERLVAAGEVELVGAPSIDWLGVPLISGNRAIGVLAVQSYRETTRYDEHARRILMYVADQVAHAIARSRSAAALRAAEERYRAFIEHSTEGVWRIEYEPPVPLGDRPPEDVAADLYRAGRIAECNEAMARMYGFERAADVVGKRPGDLHPADDPANLRVLTEFVKTGCRVVDAETRARDRQDKLRVFRMSAVGLTEGGRLVRTWGTQRDVTEQRLLEEQLRQAQKLEAVGRLAGGIAHDFNNILTAILGTTDLMLGDLPEDHPTRPDALEVRKAAMRAAELTRQLLAYSRRQVLLPRRVDVSAVVGALDPMLRRLIGEDIELVTALGVGLPPVTADPSQLEQVVLNLAVNARDAMPRGGRLRIETAAVTIAAEAEAPVPPGGYVLLAVSDTGVGMTPEVRAHLFEPFFTTKETGKGTGLGLATVYGIVRQSNAHIVVETAPGQGTVMRVYFPAAEAAAPPAPAPAEPATAPAAGHTVLLVEDEDAVRGFARRALEGAGYRVLAARDGATALAAAADHPGTIDLLLTDVVMPGMSGRALAGRFAERWPDVPVIYMSGYAEDSVLDGTDGAPLLPKPFDSDTLLRHIRRSLDRHSPTTRA